MPYFLLCVVEAACVVTSGDHFRAAIKATAAFNSRDYCLVTQSLNWSAQKCGPCVCVCCKTRHPGLKTKQEQPDSNTGKKSLLKTELKHSLEKPLVTFLTFI